MTYRVDHISLLVRDMEESVRFYTEVLGIPEVANPMGGRDIRWFEIGHGQRFHLQQGDASAIHVEKQTHFALTAEDFDGTVNRLRESGVPFTNFRGELYEINVRPDGMRAIFLEDPTGYWIEINDFRQ
jgi:catechol 2,3-dioxygenase-like lactoylglutathione lyase family enzyme